MSNLVNKILRNKILISLRKLLHKTFFIEGRFSQMRKFYDNPKGTFGRQKLVNNLDFNGAIKDKWLARKKKMLPEEDPFFQIQVFLNLKLYIFLLRYLCISKKRWGAYE